MAALMIALLLGAASRLSIGSASPSKPPLACATGWMQVEGESGVSTRVACANPGSIAGPPVGPARLLLGLPIELNLASSSTLEVLPGIGPQRAAAIVRERCRIPFERLEDAARVHGIGPKTVEALRGQAIPGAPTPDCATAPTLPP